MKKSNLFLATVALAALSFQLLTFNCTAQYTKLLNFTGIANGASPRGDLISDGTFLYGMTFSGGTKDSGTVFKIKPDGTGYSKLLDFAGTINGANPYGSLISDGTFLYGMASAGGTNNMGVIFKIKPDGTGYSKLHDFGNLQYDGNQPLGSLISDGIFLYGMTMIGGSGYGNIFKIKPDGTGYVDLHNFLNVGTDGTQPNGSLISVGTFLYGTTSSGGTNNKGTIFKIKPDGTGYIKLYDYIGYGSNPQGSLISDGTFLYGMTSGGSLGNIFKIKPDGTGYHGLLYFNGVINGKTPFGSLISDGTFLYGMTSAGGIGGTNTDGTVFKYNLLYTNNFTQTLTVCAGHSVTVGTHTHTTSATYHDTLTSYQGCDSAVTTNLTVLPYNTFTQSPTICAGHSITVGTHTYTTSATYTDHIVSLVNGCDSIVATHLTVLTANTFSQTFTKCQGQSVTIGTHTYNISGTYHDTLTSFHGCDSAITTHLTINIIDTSVSVSNAIFTANAIGATYQWMNCNGNTLISGATNQSFTATTNGSYAVIVNKNSCSDTSACHSITNVGIVENSFANAFKVYPNPFTSQTNITFAQEQKNIAIKITDELGKEIRSINFTGKQLIIEKGEMKAGIYFMQIETKQGKATQKLIIQQ